jgi:TolA-binding protein
MNHQLHKRQVLMRLEKQLEKYQRRIKKLWEAAQETQKQINYYKLTDAVKSTIDPKEKEVIENALLDSKPEEGTVGSPEVGQ